MRNPLRPVRLALLWLLDGIPLENHAAAIQRIDAGHQQQLARLRRRELVQTFDTANVTPAVIDAVTSAYLGNAARFQ